MGCHIHQQKKLIKDSIQIKNTGNILSDERLPVRSCQSDTDQSGSTTQRNEREKPPDEKKVIMQPTSNTEEPFSHPDNNQNKSNHDIPDPKIVAQHATKQKKIEQVPTIEEIQEIKSDSTLLHDNHDLYFTEDEILNYEEKNQILNEDSEANLNTKSDNQDIKWQQGQVIGVGSFGTVYMGLKADVGEIMAVKQIQLAAAPNSPDQKNALKEIISQMEMLKKLKHKNIVRCIGTSLRENTLYIFLQYVSGGSISSLLQQFGQFNEALIRNYTQQILEGLEYLHHHQVVHRDIKGANVLVDSKGVCQLADFGSAQAIVEKDQFKSLKGTANWMAPEVIKQTGYGRFSDIWSVGCTIVEMATGKPPFSNYNNPFQTMFHIAQITQPPELPSELSQQAQNFLSICFRINPQERLNAGQLLSHPFITGKNQMFHDSSKILSPIIQESENFLFSPMPQQIQGAGTSNQRTQKNNLLSPINHKNGSEKLSTNIGGLLGASPTNEIKISPFQPRENSNGYSQNLLLTSPEKEKVKGIITHQDEQEIEEKENENEQDLEEEYDNDNQEEEEEKESRRKKQASNRAKKQFTFKNTVFIDSEESNNENSNAVSPSQIGSNYLMDRPSKSNSQSNSRKNYVKQNSLSSQSSLYKETIKEESMQESHSQKDYSQIIQDDKEYDLAKSSEVPRSGGNTNSKFNYSNLNINVNNISISSNNANDDKNHQIKNQSFEIFNPEIQQQISPQHSPKRSKSKEKLVNQQNTTPEESQSQQQQQPIGQKNNTPKQSQFIINSNFDEEVFQFQQPEIVNNQIISPQNAAYHAPQQVLVENENLWGRDSDKFGFQQDLNTNRKKSFHRFPLKENVFEKEQYDTVREDA